MIASERLVFVGGLHRSGTTPLTRTLAMHPQISGLTGTGVTEDEGQHLQDVYPSANTFGGPGRFALDARAHLTEDSPLVSTQSAARLVAAWTPYWQLDRTFLMEKSPPNLVMTRFLQALYPDAAFVIVLRHPIVVALSTVKWRAWLSRRPQNRVSLEDLVRHWFAAHDTFLADVSALRRVHVLRYEDLVADPVTQLAPIGDLLGVSSSIPTAAIGAAHTQPYLVQWDRLSRSPVGRRARRRIIDQYGAVVRRFGYDPEDLTRLEPFSLPAG